MRNVAAFQHRQSECSVRRHLMAYGSIRLGGRILELQNLQSGFCKIRVSAERKAAKVREDLEKRWC